MGFRHEVMFGKNVLFLSAMIVIYGQGDLYKINYCVADNLRLEFELMKKMLIEFMAYDY